MAEKSATIPLNYVLLLPDKKGINKAYIDIILEEEIPVLCINKAARKQRLMPFKVLYDNNVNFWQQDTKWEYYLTEEFLAKIEEKAAATGAWDGKKQGSHSSGDEEPKVEKGYGSEYRAFAEMSLEEKISCLNKNKQRLTDLALHSVKDDKFVTEVLVDSTKDAALINHAALEEAMRLGDDEAKKFTQDLVDSTIEMVKSSVYIISEDAFHDDLMNTLVEKSNGTIVQHMTRVYLNGIAFLAYYHKLVSTSSAIQKLRISFATKYRKFYQALLPHLSPDDVNLERVFFGGMRAIATELYYKWAVGFLIHDIGKAAAVEYHEGESKYDRNMVVEHVKLGYKNILSKTNYPREAGLITGYHHEYYGDQGGYGYFRAYLQQYKKQNPDLKQDFVMSFEMEPLLDYKALAYFPAKVLEIIDVFDSVTDPNRVYRKAMTPEEALLMMRQEFIEKNQKIDPIIFDIFVSFIEEKKKTKTAKS
jgi:hypothetical protein